jgi:SAM-dependent methyltransferase
MTSEACPVCGGGEHVAVYRAAADPITSETFSVLRCCRCHIVHTAPRPRAMERYYPQQYRRYGRVALWALERLYSLRVARWAGSTGRPGSVLEVGCGSGMMLAGFRRRGWRVLGTERNEEAAEHGRRTLGLDIVSGDLAQLPQDARFDLIVLFQVLEHVDDPVSVLAECARRLGPGGKVVVNVPNFASWQSRFARDRWLHLDVPRHLVHYTPETLAAALRRAGLVPVERRFRSPEHDPYGWIESTISLTLGRRNVLTRYLMGLDRLDATIGVALLMAALLTLPALMLSGVSWLARRGALVELVAISAAGSGEKTG